MRFERYNYWIYAILSIFFSWIIYYLTKNNVYLLIFYLISCLYLALYFIIKEIVTLVVDRGFKDEINYNKCIKKKVNCKEIISKELCHKENSCVFNKSCEYKLLDVQQDIDFNLQKKLEVLNYYKIRGLTLQKHIEYYIVYLIITFVIFLLIVSNKITVLNI